MGVKAPYLHIKDLTCDREVCPFADQPCHLAKLASDTRVRKRDHCFLRNLERAVCRDRLVGHMARRCQVVRGKQILLTELIERVEAGSCVNENEFTYFGAALCDQIKKGHYSLEASFKMAIEKIKQRELSENLPHSEPQLFIGNMMLDKLKQLEQVARFP